MPIFKKKDLKLITLKEIPFKKEKDLQEITENNLETIFGLNFVRGLFYIKNLEIDTLAFDPETKSFVIIEYKRDSSYSIVDQGFSYLSLMHENKAEFVLAYNETFNKNFKKEDIDWGQTRLIFIAKSFTPHQINAVNFKNMPFELWEVVQFEDDLMQYRKIEISKSATSLDQIKNISTDNQKVAREIKTYTEEDVFGKDGLPHDLYLTLKTKILQLYPDLVLNPKKAYVGFQIEDNWRNMFNVNKIRDGILINFMRSTPKDFNDPQKKVYFMEKSREYYNQDISLLEIKNESDVIYAITIITQAYDRFVKEYGE